MNKSTIDCKTIDRAILNSLNGGKRLSEEVKAHVLECEGCRSAVRVDLAMESLIRLKAEADRNASMAYNNPFLAGRIRHRIREMAEQANTWESAVLSLRGWLLAFGTLALALLSFSFSGSAGRQPASLELTTINEEVSVEPLSDLDHPRETGRKRSAHAHQ